MSDREDFEKAFPAPEGVYWDSWSDDDGQYEAASPEHEELADIQQARLQGWIAARAQQGEGWEPVLEIRQNEMGQVYFCNPDDTAFRPSDHVGAKFYTHPAKTHDCNGGQDCSHCEPGYGCSKAKVQGVPEGWKFERESGDRITIDADGLGFYVARMDAERIADIMLYALAQDLLSSEPDVGGEK